MRQGGCMQFVVRWGLGFIPLFVLVGCNSDPGPRATIEKVVPASGTVTFQGKPLDHYQVTFKPTDDRRPATGITDKDGKFTLGTNTAGDGCPPGKHKIAVVWLAPTDDGLGNIVDDPSKMPKA